MRGRVDSSKTEKNKNIDNNIMSPVTF